MKVRSHSVSGGFSGCYQTLTSSDISTRPVDAGLVSHIDAGLVSHILVSFATSSLVGTEEGKAWLQHELEGPGNGLKEWSNFINDRLNAEVLPVRLTDHVHESND